jgi:hypothetical protein
LDIFSQHSNNISRILKNTDEISILLSAPHSLFDIYRILLISDSIYNHQRMYDSSHHENSFLNNQSNLETFFVQTGLSISNDIKLICKFEVINLKVDPTSVWNNLFSIKFSPTHLFYKVYLFQLFCNKFYIYFIRPYLKIIKKNGYVYHLLQYHRLRFVCFFF